MIKFLGFATVFGLFAFSQVEIPFSAWANVPAVGLLMFLLYWIIVKQGPKERKEAREHTERVVKQIGEDSKAIQKQHHVDQGEMIGKLVEHYSKVRDT